jgi:hypothetical protein
MTAVVTLTGALSDRMTVRRLQARMVKVVPDSWHDRVPQGALARLELLEGKLSRAVLRGLGRSNPARLPGGWSNHVREEGLPPDAPQVHIRGVALMGGVEVQTKEQARTRHWHRRHECLR